VWIVDSVDAERIDECRDEMHRVLADDGLRGAALLVLANKQDMSNAMKADRIAERLGMHSLRGHEWYIQPCSALSGDGLVEGLEWLHKVLNGKPTKAAAARMQRAG
jgi:hypothetical protein